jgi:cell pole-organizing protein PopZ
MSDPKSQADPPPMEEILATVRRIIAEEESGTSTSSGTSTPGAAMAPTLASALTVGGDVLELTEVLEADGSIRHIPPFGTALRGPGEKREPALGDGRIEPAAPNLGDGRQQSEGPSLRVTEASGESEPLSVAAAVSAPEPLDPITGEPATGVEPQPPLGTDRALETLVREMLRPMLQRWLDENLPVLVEEAVRAEVARTSGDPAAPRRLARARTKTKPE